MEEMPIKYVKDKDGKFLPITSPNAVINEDGKNINELYVSYESGVEVEPQINELLEKIYPIGSIYMSVNNVSPQEFLGGRWERIQDTFLLGAGSSYSAGSTGGEATHYHTWKMRLADNVGMAAIGGGNGSIAGGYNYQTNSYTTRFSEGGSITDWVSSIPTSTAQRSMSYQSISGTTTTDNNMPPYLAVYMWQRIG